MAIAAWNLMGGLIDWNALDFVCEKYGITDVEAFVERLVAIRDHQIAQSKRG